VPVFGMAAAAALLGETMPGWKLAATALVVGGLALNAVASRGGRMGRS
jgi:O-acetylserine/cysteine efflux transporter